MLALKLASIVLLFMLVLVFNLIILNPTAITTTTTSSSLSSLTLQSTSSVAALSSSSSKRIPNNNNNNNSIMTTMIAPTVVPNLLIVESPTDPARAAMNHKQGLRGSYQPITTTTTSTSTTVTTITRKKKIHLSLWLIPPGGEAEGINDDNNETLHNYKYKQQKKHNVYQSAQQLVNELSEQYHGPTFIPHVTIVGGIEVESEEEARQLSKKLQEGLTKTSYVDSSTSGNGTRTRTNTTTGSIDCHFKELLVSEPSCWNQALIVEMEPSNSFVKLCQRSRQLLGMEQQPQPQKGEQEEICSSCVSFPPPARVPHMSLYYGVPPNIPDPSTLDVSRIFGNSESDGDGEGDNSPTTTSSHRSFHFQAHRVMLVTTDPSTVDGVTEWRTIADIDLSASLSF